jgi:hypothetical protein
MNTKLPSREFLARIARENEATQKKVAAQKKFDAELKQLRTDVLSEVAKSLGKGSALGMNKLMPRVETATTSVKSQAQLIDAARTKYFAATENARLAFIAAVNKLTATTVNPSGNIRSAELASSQAAGYYAKIIELRAIYDEQIGLMRDAYLAEVSRIQNSGVIDPSPVDGAIRYGVGDQNSANLIEQIKAAQVVKPAQLQPGTRVGR